MFHVTDRIAKDIKLSRSILRYQHIEFPCLEKTQYGKCKAGIYCASGGGPHAIWDICTCFRLCGLVRQHKSIILLTCWSIIDLLQFERISDRHPDPKLPTSCPNPPWLHNTEWTSLPLPGWLGTSKVPCVAKRLCFRLSALIHYIVCGSLNENPLSFLKIYRLHKS